MGELKLEAIAQTKPCQSQQTAERQTHKPDQHAPLTQAIAGSSNASSASDYATVLNRIGTSAHSLLKLQRQYGNRYVQRVLAIARKGGGEAEAAPEVEAAIERKRGGGQALDNRVRVPMESAFGVDFSGVHVHTDSEADTLNQALSARAFTTGQDIFFAQGEYSPGSSSGRELLAHELTHVVQQTGGIHPKLALSEPTDKYEQEADRVAATVTRMLEPNAQEKATVSQPVQALHIQQKCSECQEQEEQTIQTKQVSNQIPKVSSVPQGKQSLVPRTQFSSSIVQRFGSEEHVEIGNRALPGQDVYIGSEIGKISYGELIAMAGDYFESISQIQQLANDIYGRDQILFALWKVNPTRRSRPLVSRTVEDVVMDRYYRLAARNETHFSTGSAPGRSNREQYITAHADAIAAAYAHGRSGIITGPDWQAREGFADHFLTDAFSGGHIRTPRGQIQSHWNGLYPNFSDNMVRMISCYMASYINDRDNIGYIATVNQLAEGIAPILRARAGNVLSAFSIGDLISKVMHDADNAGLDVVSPRGPAGTTTGSPFHWRAVGDEFLFRNTASLDPATQQAQQQTQQMVIEAVRLSYEEVRQAYAAGASGSSSLTALINPSNFRALALIPSENTASTTNPTYNWRSSNIRAMPTNLRSLLVAAFAPGAEVRQGLDGVTVDCITVKSIGPTNWDLHTGDAWLCFRQQLLANVFEMIARIAEGNICPPGNNNPCPGLRNPCP
ncbi:MAG TPA: DUF4157 domain-containing protein [Waterburya sp.]